MKFLSSVFPALALAMAGFVCAETPTVEIEELESRIAALGGDETVPEATRATAIEHFRDAIESTRETLRFEERKSQYLSALSNGAGEILRIQSQEEALARSSSQESPVSEDSSLAEIEQRIAQEQAALVEARAELEAVESEIATGLGSPDQLRDRKIAVAEELAELERLLRETELGPEGIAKEAQSAALEARRASLNSEAEMLEQAILSFDIRSARAGSARALARARVDSINHRIESIQQTASSRLNSAVARTERLLLRLQDPPDPSKSIAPERVQELARLIDESRRVTNRFQSLSDELTERESRIRDVTDEFARIKRQIEIGGFEGSMASILLQKIRSLPSSLDERQGLHRIRHELAEAQQSLFLLEEGSLPSEGAGEDLVGSEEVGLSSPSESESAELKEAEERLREDLESNYRRLIRELGALDLAERRYAQETARYREYLADQLFWKRSSPLIGLDTLRSVPSGLAWAFDREQWSGLLRQLFLFPGAFYVVLGLVLGCLLFFRKRCRRHLEKAGLQTRRISTDYYLNTIAAFALTFLLAVPIPLLLAAFGFAFRTQPDATEWDFGFGTALLAGAGFLLLVRFTKELASEKGLGEFHFKWNRSELLRTYRLFHWLIPIYLPACLILSLLIADSGSKQVEGIGRIVALFATIGVGAVFIVFSRPYAGEVCDDQDPEIGLFRGRLPFFFFGAVTLGLCFLLLAGFVVTAIVILVELQFTLLAGFAFFVIYGLLLRWFEIKERRLALAEAMRQRQARQEAAQAREIEEHESEEILVEEAEEEHGINLVRVGVQLRNVIRFLVSVALAGFVFWLWSEPAPLLAGLNSIYLAGSFSLTDFVVSALIVAATVSITRNLPGLLEILAFRGLAIAPGTRSAFTTLAKYAVIFASAVVVSRQIGIEWSQFSWIAAALSVGLGFGLQEVVANFVCGIILLFERPIRVGDTVTVAGVTGIVTRIQMRATTITNWDQEEFIVPNKEFITGSLINMTLSSPINRVVIPVGVAYGTDTDKVLRILSEVASGTEGVMEDPAPVITFEGFGESSLDFSVRAYLPNRDSRLGVITEIHQRIDKAFREAGIEIPFPQRDLHLRGGDGTLRVDPTPLP